MVFIDDGACRAQVQMQCERHLICVKNKMDGNWDAGRCVVCTAWLHGYATDIKSTPNGQTVTSLNDDNSIGMKVIRHS